MSRKGSLDSMLKSSRSASKKPEPPVDFAQKFTEATYYVFYQYLSARPYSEWSTTDLRLLAQAAILEELILKATDDVFLNGVTTIGAAGQTTQNPSLTSILKMQQSQGSLLRRLGISNDGMVPSAKKANLAKEAAIFNKYDDGEEISTANELLA